MQTYLQIFDCNNKHGAYNSYHFSTKRKEKIRCMRFLPKAVTVCSGEEKRFDCKNNHGYGKSANFRLDNIGKFNCRTLVALVVIYLIRVGVEKGPIGLEAI